ncbi:acyltransferase [Butyribacter intestini]|jgi:surface polysaccharide O-acyltransferase-like enzyme|uniref:acyltransferase n=1 Tax=Butyribacter intestini TaxID=1703332 RepID=UPI003A3A907E
MLKLEKRNINLDVIRCIAVFSVISVHFFNNTEFYQQIVSGKRMYCMVIMRTFFMICVPLFLILTGFLMSKKELNRKYYKGLLRTIEVYVCAELICLCFKKYILGEEIWKGRFIFDIIGVQGIDYSWYVEMYIGLFLLIPFLNLIWKGLETKKRRVVLILTLLLCTTIPTMFNIFDWSISGFWTMPSISQNYQSIMPDWWINLYPLTYYFIGTYLREYDLKISVKINILMLIVAVVLGGTFNYYRSYNSLFEWGSYNGWNGIENVINSILVFVLILHMNFDKVFTCIKKGIVNISEWSFGIYLLSWVTDQIIYSRFNALVPEMVDRLNYFLPIVISVFLCTIVLSAIVNIFCDLLEKTVVYLFEKYNKNILNRP